MGWPETMKLMNDGGKSSCGHCRKIGTFITISTPRSFGRGRIIAGKFPVVIDALFSDFSKEARAKDIKFFATCAVT